MMWAHRFSTPDGNKVYCKTCGYTREAGNHVSEPRKRAES